VQREVNALKRGAGAVAENVDPDRRQFSAGSNTWTIGPRTLRHTGPAMLLNQSTTWPGATRFYRYMEVASGWPNYDLYGAPQVGFPSPSSDSIGMRAGVARSTRSTPWISSSYT
jgi:hypothetical protein